MIYLPQWFTSSLSEGLCSTQPSNPHLICLVTSTVQGSSLCASAKREIFGKLLPRSYVEVGWNNKSWQGKEMQMGTKNHWKQTLKQPRHQLVRIEGMNHSLSMQTGFLQRVANMHMDTSQLLPLTTSYRHESPPWSQLRIPRGF